MVFYMLILKLLLEDTRVCSLVRCICLRSTDFWSQRLTYFTLCYKKGLIVVYWGKHMQRSCLCLRKSFSGMGTKPTLISGALAFICWYSPHLKLLSLYRDLPWNTLVSPEEQAVVFGTISFSTAGKARETVIKQANAQRAVVCKVFWCCGTGILFPWCSESREQALYFRETFWVHVLLPCILMLSKYRNTTPSSFSARKGLLFISVLKHSTR